jgi:hypothetical protein
MSLYILEYDYDKLCWYDIFHVFTENEFLKGNEIWLYVICEKFEKDENPAVKWGYTLITSKL